jgi:hypothetical protein
MAYSDYEVGFPFPIRRGKGGEERNGRSEVFPLNLRVGFPYPLREDEENEPEHPTPVLGCEHLYPPHSGERGREQPLANYAASSLTPFEEQPVVRSKLERIERELEWLKGQDKKYSPDRQSPIVINNPPAVISNSPPVINNSTPQQSSTPQSAVGGGAAASTANPFLSIARFALGSIFLYIVAKVILSTLGISIGVLGL